MREFQFVVGGEIQIFAHHGRTLATVGVAAFQIVLRAGLRAAVTVGIVKLCVACHLVAAIFIVEIVVRSHGLRGCQSLRQAVGTPVAVASGLAVVIQVVHRAEERQARMVTETEGEETGQITVAGAVAGLGVSHPTDLVLLFQNDVHHERAVAHVAPGKDALHSRLGVGLHLIHHVRRQVFQHYRAILREEVFAIQQQFVHKAAIYLDLSLVV